MSTTALRVENLEVRYGPALALRDVSFDLEPGSMVAVVGPNGAGKSSIARAVSGLVPTSSGRIELAGRDVTGHSAARIRRAGLIHLPEGRGIFPNLTVNENLRMAVTLIERAARSAAIERAYEIFAPLADRRRQAAGTLSGGEQQMLSLARALATQPTVIVADEMSLGLAPKMVDMVFASLEQIRATGVAVVLIEQYVHRALAAADHCVMVQRGEVAWAGPTADARGAVLDRFLGGAAS